MSKPNKLLNKYIAAKGSYERNDITMAKLNRICTICHKKYSYCPTCGSDINKPTWMAVFCEENCKDLYNVINDYRHKSLSKEEAFCKLNILDLSCINELPDNFKQILDEILNEKHNEKDVFVEINKEDIEVENVEQEVELVNEEIIQAKIGTENIDSVETTDIPEVSEDLNLAESNYKKTRKRNYNKN